MTHFAEHELVETTGGALAIRDVATGEVMHPVVGPRVESRALYVGPAELTRRLLEPGDDPLVLLDVGLGAGSNAVAALQVAEALQGAARRLEIVSFDRTLSALALALAPAHAEAFGFEGALRAAGLALLEQGHYESARCRWRLRLGELMDELRREPDGSADVLFWDPFSPRRSPALWTVATFCEARRLCRGAATLHTYSAATSVRTALLLAGFSVGLGVGVGTKQKSTTVAALAPEALREPLGPRFLERVARSSAAYPADAPRDAWDRIAALPQFTLEGVV